jgi:2-octaprenyl-6-methoxyphenol hydroxylase
MIEKAGISLQGGGPMESTPFAARDSARRVDAVVVGGGLSGLAAVVAVAKTGLGVVHVAPKAHADRRTSALMMPSVAYLQEAGLIGDPAEHGVPLTQIRIIDATRRLLRAPETLFDSAEARLPAFGWNFANAKLNATFEAAKAAFENIQTIETTVAGLKVSDESSMLTLANGETLETALLVGADGKRSLVREEGDFRAREYGFTQAALVCDLTLGRSIGGTSVEFHYPQGPFTLVPAGDRRANLVWIDDRAVLEAAKDAGAEGLIGTFLEKSMRLFGTIELASPAHIFPLSTLSVEKAGAGGVVLVGEAAHAFPPIGAQGLNLGLRDVEDLSAALEMANGTEPGWAKAVSEDYARRRAGDLARTGAVVDGLFRSLLAEMLPAQALRAGGLWALKLVPGLRRQAFAIGMGKR